MSETASKRENLESASLDEGVKLLYELDREELIRIILDDAKNWLAHDGLWF